MRICELLDKIREELDYARTRRELSDDQRYWDGYIDRLLSMKEIVEELCFKPPSRSTNIFDEIAEEVKRKRRRWWK